MTKKEVLVLKDILGTNKKIAAEIRAKCREKGILAVNLLSSPGSGKTTLLEALSVRLGKRFRVGVIEGDIETERDAERIRAHGIPAWQITTNGACHLEAKMVGRVLAEVPADLDFLFIENVGNLVCPASYDLGEELRFILLSSPEGDDKPKKYPEAFLSSQVLVLTKSDLLPYLPFDPEKAKAEALDINPRLATFIVLRRERRRIGRPSKSSSSPPSISSGRPAMHELSLVAELFVLLEEKAREEKASRINRISLSLGRLSGVVPELLESAFDSYKKGTLASDAELRIDVVPLKVHCRACGKETADRRAPFRLPSLLLGGSGNSRRKGSRPGQGGTRGLIPGAGIRGREPVGHHSGCFVSVRKPSPNPFSGSMETLSSHPPDAAGTSMTLTTSDRYSYSGRRSANEFGVFVKKSSAKSSPSSSGYKAM